ncbi:MAG: biopolymer transporter ExbD [Burkholderiaceae bacterium]|jgi:biopolymer transport protein ExbD|uniref:Biopolymer transporter ExbD n=1 Tax=Herminiimonas contaminans TaxID=1111140 RepID=A0ABS0EW81_9BURK|nr:biopolymer transporter ExbD [Herminiimonas contaminans]MBF8179000.1 biopolymer transporter ExbD [Herminiimonas contaminans]MBX9797990.1 biopolymer transporter ExbD [Burkholderiaceae bacterium]
MNFRKGQGREDPEINLIAFIDVLLVILIFLMVSTSYSKFTALQITLPTADAEKAMDRPFEINVGVDTQGRYSINNARVAVQNPDALAAELSAAVAASSKPNADPVIIIAADATATHQTVINVLEAARIAGYSKVTFAAQTSGKK